MRHPFPQISSSYLPKWLFPIGLILTLTASAPQPVLPAAINLTGYTLTFSDNFSSLSVSPHGPNTVWIAHTPWNGDFGDAAFDNPVPGFPFTTSPTGLTITARRDQAGKWHAGLLCSRNADGPAGQGFAQQYGYFEMRAKLPAGSGTWPAFWLIGVNKQVTASEIDVVEFYGGFPNYYHVTEHIWKNGIDTRSQSHLVFVPDSRIATQFNNYGILITHDTTSFYFNRRPIWSTPTPPEYRQPMYLLVNLAIGGGWPSASLPSPTRMEVRYIDVYQLPKEQ